MQVGEPDDLFVIWKDGHRRLPSWSTFAHTIREKIKRRKIDKYRAFDDKTNDIMGLSVLAWLYDGTEDSVVKRKNFQTDPVPKSHPPCPINLNVVYCPIQGKTQGEAADPTMKFTRSVATLDVAVAVG
jgi:hypothetical protein